MIEAKLKLILFISSQELQPWTAVSTLLGLLSTVEQKVKQSAA